MEDKLLGLENRGVRTEETDEEDKVSTLFFSAVEANDLQTVESLLEDGADVNIANKNGDTLLHTAARFGRPHLCSLLINNGAEINVTNKSAYTPLFLAARVSLQTVQILIQFGGDVELGNHLGEIPLHAASSSGLVDVIVLLISSGSDVNARSTQGLTPLYLAIGSGSRNAVKTLLRFGADVNRVFEPEPLSTARSVSAESHSFSRRHVRVRVPRQVVRLPRRQDSDSAHLGDVAEEAAEHDGGRCPPDSHGAPGPRCAAEQWRHQQGPIRPRLLLHGDGLARSPQAPLPQARIRHKHGLDLHVDLAQRCRSLFPRPFHLQSAHTVSPSTDSIVTKVPPSVTGHNWRQPPQQNDNQPLRRQRRAEDAWPSADFEPRFSTFPQQPCRRRKGFLLPDEGSEFSSNSAPRAFDSAANLHRHSCQSLPISYRPAYPPSAMQTQGRGQPYPGNPAGEQPAVRGVTPLHRAAQLGMESVAKVLLESGADVNARTVRGETPLHFAAKYSSTLGHGEVTGLLRLLIASGADIEATTSSAEESALHLAALVGDALAASILISAGAEVNRRDAQGDCPLHKACRRIVAPEANRVRTVRLLLTSGASANAVNCSGHSPLHLLLLLRDDELDLDVVRVLLSHQADPNQRTQDGQHPLLLALDNRLFDLAKVLVEKGAEANVRADDGRTPLHYVCKAGHSQLFKAVWAKGGNPTAVDARGFSPLRYAVESGVDAMVRACLNTGASTWQPALVTDQFSLDSNTTLNDIRDSSSSLTSPFQYAFCNSQHAILRALLSSGCFTFAELHSLRTLCQVLDQAALSACQLQVVRVVLDASEAPPLLQHLCCWTISHLIGFRADRKLLARRLGLPAMLRDFILFVNGA